MCSGCGDTHDRGVNAVADGGGMNTGNANRHMSNEIRQKQKKHSHGGRGLWLSSASDPGEH
jgi:hypothetical protein